MPFPDYSKLANDLTLALTQLAESHHATPCGITVLNEEPTAKDIEKVLTLKSILVTQSEGNIEIGFCNQAGEYDHTSLTNPTVAKSSIFTTLTSSLKKYTPGNHLNCINTTKPNELAIINDLNTFLESLHSKSHLHNGIEKLDEPRKTQAQFLMAVINHLESTHSNGEQSANRVAILLGAIMVVIRSVKMEYAASGWLWSMFVGDERNSYLHTLTDNFMTKLTLEEKIRCIKEFNRWLQTNTLIRVDTNTINPNCLLVNTSTEKYSQVSRNLIIFPELIKFAILAYELEKDLQNEFIDVLSSPVETESLPVPEKHKSTFSFKNQTTLNPSQKPKSLNTLVTALTTLTTKVLAKYKVATIESLATNPSCDKTRAQQLAFLTILGEMLKTSPEDPQKEAQKVMILTGAMHTVRAQIAESYERTLLVPPTREGSLTESELIEITGIETSAKELAWMVHATDTYVRFNTLHKSAPASTIPAERISSAPLAMPEPTSDAVSTTILAEHPFSGIPNFDLKKLLKSMQEIRCLCLTTAITDAYEAHKVLTEVKPEIPAAKAGGIISYFWSSAPPKAESSNSPQHNSTLS